MSPMYFATCSSTEKSFQRWISSSVKKIRRLVSFFFNLRKIYHFRFFYQKQMDEKVCEHDVANRTNSSTVQHTLTMRLRNGKFVGLSMVCHSSSPPTWPRVRLNITKSLIVSCHQSYALTRILLGSPALTIQHFIARYNFLFLQQQRIIKQSCFSENA